MVAMRVMQMAVDPVVDVIAMRDRLVPAARPVPMAGSAPMSRGAAIGIVVAERDRVLIHPFRQHHSLRPVATRGAVCDRDGNAPLAPVADGIRTRTRVMA